MDPLLYSSPTVLDVTLGEPPRYLGLGLGYLGGGPRGLGVASFLHNTPPKFPTEIPIRLDLGDTISKGAQGEDMICSI